MYLKEIELLQKLNQIRLGPQKLPLSGLLDAVASLYLIVTEERLISDVSAFIEKWVPVQHINILEFRKGLQPRLLMTEGGGYDHDLNEYLSGLYLLDPYYDLYENQGQTGIFKLNLEDWNNYSSGDDYKRYWRMVKGNNEVAGLYEIADQHCIHVSFMIQSDESGLVRDAVEFMRLLESNFRTLFRLHFYMCDHKANYNESTRRDIHTAVSTVLDNFGKEILSERERDVVRLLLKGHSAKSIAKLLDITAGTVSVHRTNIYQKLGVGGQGDLFSSFVASLTNLK